MAGVLENLIIVVPLQFDEDSPWACPRFLVDHRCAIFKPVLADTREPFDDSQLFTVITGITGIACSIGTNRVFVGKVRRFDDERVSFPVSARIAHEHLDLRIDMATAVKWKHPSLVN